MPVPVALTALSEYPYHLIRSDNESWHNIDILHPSNSTTTTNERMIFLTQYVLVSECLNLCYFNNNDQPTNRPLTTYRQPLVLSTDPIYHLKET